MALFGKTSRVGGIVLCAIILRLFFFGRKDVENIVLSTIAENGYRGELHQTTTEDGYILGIHRILTDTYDGRNSVADDHNKNLPIIFVHGLESSAVDWINHHGRESLPFLMLEEGYDVWLGNVRGTQASYNHTSLDPQKDSEKFWDSSIHEIGYYDLPAMIDYVLKKSGSEKLIYVGISQGEATFLVMASTRPEYNNKIQLAALTSPSSHLRHSDNVFLKSLGSMWPTLQKSASVIGLHTVPGRNLLGTICQYQVLSHLCSILSSPLLGYLSPEQMQAVSVSKLFQVYPVKSAFKQLLHYLQMYNSGIFRRFDYGKEENLKRYGTEEPPAYNMENVTAPVAYFWGENDCWVRPKDMEEIEEKLPNLVLSYKIPHKSFNHYDIFMAKDVKELAYRKMIETILRYSKREN